MTLIPVKNSLFGLFMLTCGLFLLRTAFTSPYAGPAEEDPMFFPRLLLIPWVALSALVLIRDAAKKEPILPPMQSRSLLPAIALLGAAAALLPVVGFLPVSFVFFLLYARLMGYRQVRLLVPLSAAFTVATWYLFNFILEIQLPAIPFME